MQREELNLYIDSFLALAPEPGYAALRTKLIEIASSEDFLEDTLKEWIWTLDIGVSRLLEIRIWFGLSYESLGRLFDRNPKEIAQLIKNQRAERMSPYQPQDKTIGGLSCFMVDQLLSAWVDDEILEITTLKQLRSHLDHCDDCSRRINEYREIHHQLRLKRKVESSVSDLEWTLSLKRHFKRRQWFWIKVFTIFLLIMGFAGFITWVMTSKPEKMPNIYESEE